MPIYEYSCNECGKVFEVFLGIKDKGPEKCLHCKSANIKKLVSNCSFQLKGTGWYLTDYARKDSNSGNGKKKPDQKKDATETSKTTESKTAETTQKESKTTQEAA